MDDIDVAISNGFGKASVFLACVKVTRAVIQLHKPEQYQTFEVCSECISDRKSTLVPIDEIYPCPTIKAVAKELE